MNDVLVGGLHLKHSIYAKVTCLSLAIKASHGSEAVLAPEKCGIEFGRWPHTRLRLADNIRILLIGNGRHFHIACF